MRTRRSFRPVSTGSSVRRTVSTSGSSGIESRLVVELTVAANEMEAQMIVGLLRTSGIAADVQPTNQSAGVFGSYSAGGGMVAVWVGERDLEQARELLENRLEHD